MHDLYGMQVAQLKKLRRFNVSNNDLVKIEDLDCLKNQTLMATYLEVNNNFKKIFSTLLPGAMASIELENEHNIQ